MITTKVDEQREEQHDDKGDRNGRGCMEERKQQNCGGKQEEI